MHPYGLKRSHEQEIDYGKWGRKRKKSTHRRGTKLIHRRVRRKASLFLREGLFEKIVELPA